jgi:hypothetical protein
MHRPSSLLQSSGLGSDNADCGFQQLKAADDSHPQAADWEFFLIIPSADRPAVRPIRRVDLLQINSPAPADQQPKFWI